MKRRALGTVILSVIHLLGFSGQEVQAKTDDEASSVEEMTLTE